MDMVVEFRRRCVRARALAAVQGPALGLPALVALVWMAVALATGHQAGQERPAAPVAVRMVAVMAAAEVRPLGVATSDDGDWGSDCSGGERTGAGCGGDGFAGRGLSGAWGDVGQTPSGELEPVRTARPQDAGSRGGSGAPNSGGSSGPGGLSEVFDWISRLLGRIGRGVDSAVSSTGIAAAGSTPKGADAPVIGGGHGGADMLAEDTSGHAASRTGTPADLQDAGPGWGDQLAEQGLFAVGHPTGSAGTVGMTPAGARLASHARSEVPSQPTRLGLLDPTAAEIPSSRGGRLRGAASVAAAAERDPVRDSIGDSVQQELPYSDPPVGVRWIDDKLGSPAGPETARLIHSSNTAAYQDTTTATVAQQLAELTGRPAPPGRSNSLDAQGAQLTDEGMAVPTADGGALTINPTTRDPNASVTPDLADGRYLITADNPDAPTDYTFELSMPKGAQAVTNALGGVDVVDHGGEVIQRLATPWARDATGRPVPTSFTVKGNTLTQHIAPEANSIYPILADPDTTGTQAAPNASGAETAAAKAEQPAQAAVNKKTAEADNRPASPATPAPQSGADSHNKESGPGDTGNSDPTGGKSGDHVKTPAALKVDDGVPTHVADSGKPPLSSPGQILDRSSDSVTPVNPVGAGDVLPLSDTGQTVPLTGPGSAAAATPPLSSPAQILAPGADDSPVLSPKQRKEDHESGAAQHVDATLPELESAYLAPGVNWVQFHGVRVIVTCESQSDKCQADPVDKESGLTAWETRRPPPGERFYGPDNPAPPLAQVVRRGDLDPPDYPRLPGEPLDEGIAVPVDLVQGELDAVSYFPGFGWGFKAADGAYRGLGEIQGERLPAGPESGPPAPGSSPAQPDTAPPAPAQPAAPEPAPVQPGSLRPPLAKPQVSDTKLTNIVNDLYKGTTNPNRSGTGTTADAVRSELRTGQPTGGRFHSQKAIDYSNALKKLLDGGQLNAQDRLVAQSLLDDLQNALKGN
jgi:hypothetical protein